MKCTYKGCKKDAVARGLCAGHYTQYYRGKDLKDIKEASPKNPIIDDKRKCRTCGKVKPIGDFYLMNKRTGKRSTDCKSCYSKKVVDRRK
jgi:hypothetical protein